jgi:hypothetical protein
MNCQIGGNRSIDMLQELAELAGAMTRPTLADHRPGGDVQGSEKIGGAMAEVVVGSTFDLSGPHGKDGLTTAQGLDLTLLIHTQYDRVMRWVHVQADYVAYLVDQQRIIR